MREPSQNGHNIFNKPFQAAKAVNHSLFLEFLLKKVSKLATFALFGINGCKLLEKYIYIIYIYKQIK